MKNDYSIKKYNKYNIFEFEVVKKNKAFLVS